MILYTSFQFKEFLETTVDTVIAKLLEVNVFGETVLYTRSPVSLNIFTFRRNHELTMTSYSINGKLLSHSVTGMW